MPNAYTYVPPCTAGELNRLYWGEGLTQSEIAAHLGVGQHVIQKAMVKAEIPTRQRVPRDQRGERNGNWKGGRTLAAKRPGYPGVPSGGYWYVRAPDHPNANRSGYVAEHIKIATEARGNGALGPGECVHHVNLRKQDNRPENLVIVDRKRHAIWHRQLEGLVGQLFAAEMLAFDAERGYSLI